MLFGAMKSRSLAPGSLGLRTKWTTRSDHAWVEGHYAAWPYVRSAMHWSLVMLGVAGLFAIAGDAKAAAIFGTVGYLFVWWFLRAAVHEANHVARKVLREPEPEPKIKPGKLVELKKHPVTDQPASLGKPSGKATKRPSGVATKVRKLPTESSEQKPATQEEKAAPAKPAAPKVSKLPKKVSKLGRGEGR